jgi:hypothetical protein
LDKTARSGWKEKECQHRTARPRKLARQPEEEKQNSTAMKGLPGKGGQDRAERIGLSAQDSKDKIARAEQKEVGSQKRTVRSRTVRTGQPEWVSQNRRGRTA